MCGGHDGSNYLSSCEVNVAGEDNWSTMTSLPGVRFAVKELTIDNRVLMTGEMFILPLHLHDGHLFCAGGEDRSSYHDDIYEMDLATKQWTNVGNLLDSRDRHGVSVVNNTESLWQYCK